MSLTRMVGTWMPARIDRARQAPTFVILASLALHACDATGAGASGGVHLSAYDSAGVRMLELSHSLKALSDGSVKATVLLPDLDLGGAARDFFEFVVDVTSLQDGRIAVLDRGALAVLMFGKHGDLQARIGRRGEGPGEFERPLSLAAVGRYLVVVQGLPTRTVTVLSAGDGQVAAVRSQPAPGDWVDAQYRGRKFYEFPFSSPEDLTQRLVRYDETSFAFLLYPSELADTTWLTGQSRPARWIRFNLRGERLDTVAIDEGPPLRRGGDVVRDQLYTAEEFNYASRPLLATGAGWVAVGHGARSRIEFRSTTGELLGELRWPSASRPIDDIDRLARAQWSVAYTIRIDAGARRNYERSSRREVDRVTRRHASQLAFASQAPEIMAMYGAGKCLALAGFTPADSPDGTGRTWLVLNVASGTLEGVFRIGREDRRVRHIDEFAIYASYLDSVNVPHVERYPLRTGCSEADPKPLTVNQGGFR